MKLRNRLKVLRVANGDLTQQALADKVACSRQTIHSIECEKFAPSVELALRIASVLNVKGEDIFFFQKLIRLKTFELVQRLTTWVLIAIAVSLVFLPNMLAIYPVLCLVATCMYGEIFGKIYYRRKF